MTDISSPLLGTPAVARREQAAPVNYDQTPDQRLADRAAARDNADPWSNRDLALLRDDAGNLIQRPIVRDPVTGEATVAPPESRAQAAADGQTTTEGGERFKFGDVELSHEDLQGLMARQAEEQLRKANLPADPNGYKIELAPDFKWPGGVELNFDVNNPARAPAFEAAREWAHKNGLSQAQFSELLGLYASSTAGEQAMVAAAHKTEVERLGPNGPMRVDGVHGWLRSFFGDQVAKTFLSTMVKAEQVSAWEKVISALTRQGSGGFRTSGRQADQEPRVSDADYERMSYTQKKEYAEHWSGGGRR
jgi:hypothetical protein